MTKTFPKQALIALLRDDNSDLEVVLDEITDTSRWSIQYDLVFKEIATGDHYRTFYQRGATECQDESPFEYEPDDIPCIKVKAVEVKKIEWQNA